ncbi:sigma factor [Devosia rhodophyticola]|uniref:Sigma factor n=1 Tax=Devosia rhodophyticola TaxID=3026423 RepID=A0ABY7YUZ8_9HYPH|nr:DUF6596 domain-containing protein [Devosia rhodophyticola]WDR05074.1 sigma factor [Devosia rhodophyticola]
MPNDLNHGSHRVAEQIARQSYGRLVAFLAARTRDLPGAEDALADAFAAALRLWPSEGIPENPDAWLLTVARHRQTDALRRHQTRQKGMEHLSLMAEEIEAATAAPAEIPDRRLALMFACAHPEIECAMRTPLILQTILGLPAHDVAAALMISPATMGQRLVRAKARIKNLGIAFSLPERQDLPERLDAVLEAVYAAYARGWNEIEPGDTPQLVEEAVWLGELTVQLLPDEPEAKGMLALMLYAEARRSARRDADGAFVPLEQQNTALWDVHRIGQAETLLHQANRAGPSGRYQIEAAIQSAHTARRLSGQTSWPAIVALYEHLQTIVASPVVALNHIAALAETKGPIVAHQAIVALAADKRMADYQPYWATRGHLAARAGYKDDAYEALTLAIGLSSDEAVRQYLRQQIVGLRDG